jgi:copper transport protein
VATRSRTRAVDAAAVVTALGLLACFSLAGHPAVSDVPALTVADDVAHLAAVTVWLGGLLMLTVRLLPDPRAELGEVLRRWSPVAMSAVSLILVTGTIQAWRELAGVSALVDTGYGRWLLVKTGGLVALVALGNLGRRSVRAWAREPVPALAGASLGAMRAQPRPVLRDRLRRSVAAELMIAAGVLVASTLLVVADPRQRPAASAPAVAIASSARVALPTGPMVNVTADPATAGAPTLTITTSSTDGSVLDPVEVDATAAMPAHGIEPIPLPLTRTDAGHYRVEAAPMGFAGVWDVTVTVRTSDIDSGVGTVKITLH